MVLQVNRLDSMQKQIWRDRIATAKGKIDVAAEPKKAVEKPRGHGR